MHSQHQRGTRTPEVMGGGALLVQPLLSGQGGAEGGWGRLVGRHAGWKHTTGKAATALSFVPQEHNG